MTEHLSLNSNISRSELTASFGRSLEFDKALAPYSSYGTGGNARFFMEIHDPESLAVTFKEANKLGLAVCLIGGGTNILISDSGFDGLVLKVSIGGMKLIESDLIECGAGEQLSDLVTFAADNSLTGLEFAAGIVGTVGGAVYGNAGAYGGDIGSIIEEFILVGRDGKIKTVPAEYGRFEYRGSHLKQSGEVVAMARFRLRPGEQQHIRRKIDEIIATREAKLPYDDPSAGCFFKNIPDPTQKHGKLAAGQLLDQVDAKSMSHGGAAVSIKHANIIINTGNASSKDIRILADKLREKVYEKFGIRLEDEVVQIGQI